MLQPARRKYRKEQKGRNKGVATVGAKVSFGEYGLKAVGRGRLTARQIEAASPDIWAVNIAAGYTSICFKPSMYTDDAASIPALAPVRSLDAQGWLCSGR